MFFFLLPIVFLSHLLFCPSQMDPDGLRQVFGAAPARRAHTNRKGHRIAVSPAVRP